MATVVDRIFTVAIEHRHSKMQLIYPFINLSSKILQKTHIVQIWHLDHKYNWIKTSYKSIWVSFSCWIGFESVISFNAQTSEAVISWHPLSWTEIKISLEVRRQFRVKTRSMLEPLWCNANYGYTRIKVKYDFRSKLNHAGATGP